VTPQPALDIREPSAPTRAVALVLHGGRARGMRRVRGRQLAVLRMRPFSSALYGAGSPRGLAVAALRYAVRGWNGAAQSPVADVRWALHRIRRRFPDAPVALVGHSMGGRAALYAADEDGVRAVVGLAPWIEARDQWQQLAGRALLVVHGDRDRVTSAPASAAYVRHAADVADSASYVAVRGDNHAMLRRARLWHELCTGWVLAKMCGEPPLHDAGAHTARLLERILAGEAAITA
jgi:dienelactone hydrolase